MASTDRKINIRHRMIQRALREGQYPLLDPERGLRIEGEPPSTRPRHVASPLTEKLRSMVRNAPGSDTDRFKEWVEKTRERLAAPGATESRGPAVQDRFRQERETGIERARGFRRKE